MSLRLQLWPLVGVGFPNSRLDQFTGEICRYLKFCRDYKQNPIFDMTPEGYSLHTDSMWSSILAMSETFGFGSTDITLITGDISADSLQYACKVIKHRNYWMEEAVLYLKKHNTEFTWNPQKTFGHFIGRTTWDRLAIHSEIKHNYSVASHYSFHTTMKNDFFIGQTVSKIVTNNTIVPAHKKQMLLDLNDAPTSNLAREPGLRRKLIAWPDNVEPLRNVYSDIFVDIVHETDISDDNFFVTEKTIRPIMFKRPFLSMSGKNFLSKLRQLGFKTFDTWFDETYDSLDTMSRLTGIRNRMENISKWTRVEKKAMLKDMQSTIEHNYEHLKSAKFVRHYKEFDAVDYDAKGKYFE